MPDRVPARVLERVDGRFADRIGESMANRARVGKWFDGWVVITELAADRPSD
jgi:hypothetical protein